MEAELASTITVIVHIIGSIIAAYLSYVIYTYTKSKAWLAFTLAFIFVFIRRLIGVGMDFDFFFDSLLFKKIEGIMLIMISGLYIWGLFILKNQLEAKRRK